MFQSFTQKIHEEGASVRAYELCAREARSRIPDEPQNAAALFLIGNAAQRFVDLYEDQPLTVTAATEEFERFRSYTEELSEAYESGSDERKLAALNGVASRMTLVRISP